ncbi:MAG: CmcI family methyltransferase [Bacteroidetes bacterium]|nr:CmcI family methyltransferase [Bacteroidota bacterium]
MLGLTKHTNYKLRDIDAGHHRVTYKGIPAIKCPFDYVLYQMLIMQVQPDLIIEIGTNKGGTTLYLADLLQLNGKGEIHTIDISTNEEDASLHQHPRTRVFKQGYEGYDTSILSAYSTILVIEDGSHMYEDVLASLKKFGPFVTPGSYFIAEDGIVNELGKEKLFNGGPQRAIREFLQQETSFETDRYWCDFFGPNATFNVNGYLKKIATTR